VSFKLSFVFLNKTTTRGQEIERDICRSAKALELFKVFSGKKTHPAFQILFILEFIYKKNNTYSSVRPNAALRSTPSRESTLPPPLFMVAFVPYDMRRV